MGNTLQSVDRALRILLTFETEGQEVGVGEIATLLDVHKSTASRLAATLSAHGLLERVPESERFRLGPQLGRLGMLATRGRDLVEVARKPMADLAAETGETVTLTVRHGDEMATVAQVDTRYVVGVQNWLGRRTPLHCTSDGKVLLAFGRAELSDGSLVAMTDRTVTSTDELERQLAETRANGWASAIGEVEDGLNGAAAPVLDASGNCRAAVSVSGPAYRVRPKDLPRLGGLCRETAAKIGAYLVWSSNGAGKPNPEEGGAADEARR
jgi:DNA-binding IclR family transcriptional regulator